MPVLPRILAGVGVTVGVGVPVGVGVGVAVRPVSPSNLTPASLPIAYFPLPENDVLFTVAVAPSRRFNPYPALELIVELLFSVMLDAAPVA